MSIRLGIACLLMTMTSSVLAQSNGEQDYLKYKVKKGEWVLGVIRDLGLKPLYGPDGYLAKTMTLNPAVITERGNMIKVDSVMILPIKQLPAGAHFSLIENNFIEHQLGSAESNSPLAVEKPVAPSSFESPADKPAIVPLVEAGSGASKSERPYGLGFFGGVGLGFGSVGNNGTNFKDRSTTMTSVYLLPGVKYTNSTYHILFGPTANYQLVGQNSKLSDGTNVKGRIVDGGVAILGRHKKWYLFWEYDFWGQYDVDKKTAGGSHSSFTVLDGFKVAAGYYLSSHFSVSLSYFSLVFDKNNVGGVTTVLSKPLAASQMAVGIEYTY